MICSWSLPVLDFKVHGRGCAFNRSWPHQYQTWGSSVKCPGNPEACFCLPVAHKAQLLKVPQWNKSWLRWIFRESSVWGLYHVNSHSDLMSDLSLGPLHNSLRTHRGQPLPACGCRPLKIAQERQYHGPTLAVHRLPK